MALRGGARMASANGVTMLENWIWRAALASMIVTAVAAPAWPQGAVEFPTADGGIVRALTYGQGQRAVVLAHGGQYAKESWHEFAGTLVDRGFLVLAFDFRGYGTSRGPTSSGPDDQRHQDVLGALRYVRQRGATSVFVVGASMGGDYAAQAAEAEPGAIDRLVLLAAGAYTPLVQMTGRKLFIMSRDDVIGDNQPRMPAIRTQFERASPPKTFVELEGVAHAQRIFATSQKAALTDVILRFLLAP